MYRPERILIGAPNARDLGGIETADGKTIRHGRVLRSGALWDLRDEDVRYLESIGLRTVVDFRTLPELEQRPDRVIDGVEYVHCPMLEQETEGITRTDPMNEDEEALRSIAMARMLMPINADGRAQMKSLYPILVTLDHSIEHYRRFFEILLRHESGALLYHCSMGKDRVGVGTALFLSALGVPQETIVADYMITRERCADGTERLMEHCRKYTDDPAMLEFIRWLDMVEEDFILAALNAIDVIHGGMDTFLHEKMGLDDAALHRLKELYLE